MAKSVKRAADKPGTRKKAVGKKAVSKKAGGKKAAAKKVAGKDRATERAAAAGPLPPVPHHTPPMALGAGAAVLDRLWNVIQSRRDADPAISHSARLLSRGTAKIAQKFGEEAIECVIEASLGNPDGVVGESADVLYHLLVLWVDGGIRPQDVWAELQRREGVSGIAEKASRARKLPAALGIHTRKIP